VDFETTSDGKHYIRIEINDEVRRRLSENPNAHAIERELVRRIRQLAYREDTPIKVQID
jgi:hypothetical protein